MNPQKRNDLLHQIFSVNHELELVLCSNREIKSSDSREISDLLTLSLACITIQSNVTVFVDVQGMIIPVKLLIGAAATTNATVMSDRFFLPH